MESRHDGDETKGSLYSFVQDYIAAREAFVGSVCMAGPKDLTVTGIHHGTPHWIHTLLSGERLQLWTALPVAWKSR
jgi:hypothetical protein